MQKEKLGYKISDCYNYELNEIGNKLNQLECGRVYELSGAQMDGYLATNIDQLRKMISKLLWKIENGEDGTDEELDEIMKNVYI